MEKIAGETPLFLPLVDSDFFFYAYHAEKERSDIIFFFFSFYTFFYFFTMPSGSSSPITAEDMMPSSALSVSPLLTASIFEEIATSDSGDIEQLSIGDNPLSTRDHFYSDRSDRYYENRSLFVPPPPSLRWTRRLSTLRRNIEQENNFDGPVSHPNQSFPYSATANFIYGQNCLNGRAVQMSPILAKPECYAMNMLDFDIVLDDGGQYG